MMQAAVGDVERAEESRTAIAGGRTQRFAPMALLATLFVVAAVNVVWFAFDHRVPTTDEAGHILNALQYKELLRHAHVLKLHWWQDLLTVNSFYPPSVYMFSGALKLLCGEGRWVDNALLIGYSLILTGSVYGIAWRVSKSVAAAVVAALVINLYPQIANLSHAYMLDLPLAALVSAGVLALMWWRSDPNWRRTSVTAVVLSTACFTKQLGAAYLLPVCLYLLVRESNAARVRLIAVGAAVSALMAPWVLLNLHWIKQYAQENAVQMQGAAASPFAVFGDYWIGLAYSMTPLLVFALGVALLSVKREHHRELGLIYVCAVGGLFVTSLLSCTFPLDRYAAPALVLPAVLTGIGLGMGMRGRTGKSAPTVASGVLLLLATLQYVSFSFCPSPLYVPGINELTSVFNVQLREFRGARIDKTIPMDTRNWGQQWVIDTISARDPGMPVWLNVLPSHGFFNPHSFELLARESKSPIRPTSSRRWTIMGDTIDFSPKTTLYYHWFLVKTGEQGNKFRDEKAESNYNELLRFVQTSGKFTLAAQRPLPDHSMMYLYRQQ